MFSNILFPTDFSACSNQAIGHALALARKSGAVLHLFHADTIYEHDLPLEDRESLTGEMAGSEIRNLAEGLAFDGADDVRIHRAEGRSIRVADAVLEYAAAHNIDLMIMGTHGRKGLSRWLMDSIAEELIDRADCPVMTQRLGVSGSRVEISTILVPVLFGNGCRETLQQAMAMAQLFEARLHVLHVFDGTELRALGMAPDDPHAAHKLLGGLLKELNPGNGSQVDFRLNFHSGEPKNEILEFARENQIDLIVMGHIQPNEKARRFFAGITKGVMREAYCPVFAAPLQTADEPAMSIATQ